MKENSDTEPIQVTLGVLKMIVPARLSSQGEFTPVPSCGSEFVYKIPPENVTRNESHWHEFTRFLNRSEDFIPVQNLATVSYKRRTTCFGMKKAAR